MASDQERTTSDLKKQDTTAKKKQTEMRNTENGVIGRLVAWGGAFAFACLLIASTFKMRKKITVATRSRDDGGSDDLETTGCDDEARKMEGLRLLLQPSSTDLISRSSHTTAEMLVKYASVEDSDSDSDSDSDDNRTPATEPTGEKNKDDEKMVVIIYEDEEWPDSENSVENEAPKYDEATWVAAEWTDKSSEEENEEENSCCGDGKNIDIVIYIDGDYSFDEEGRMV